MIEEHKKVTGRASTNNELHHMTYKTMREKYKDTAAQLIEQARTIAWKNRKQGKPKKCIVRFDKRLFSMAETKRGNPILSLRLTKRRIGLPVVLYQRIREHIAQGWKATSVLMTDKLRFYLVISKEDQQLLLPQQAEKNMLGIDVNASKIAVSIIITSGKKDTQTALPWQAYWFYAIQI
jgi:transposase